MLVDFIENYGLHGTHIEEIPNQSEIKTLSVAECSGHPGTRELSLAASSHLMP